MRDPEGGRGSQSLGSLGLPGSDRSNQPSNPPPFGCPEWQSRPDAQRERFHGCLLLHPERMPIVAYTCRSMGNDEKPLIWIGSSRKDLRAMPRAVQREFGFALHLAQTGSRHANAKVLRGFGSAGVLEVVENFATDTYRAVYTVRFADAVYVLHCFKKKSTKGIETPKPDLDLILKRLDDARRLAEGD